MSKTPEVDPTTTEPGADGGMGISSERTGPIRGKTDPEGQGGVAHDSAPTHTDAEPELDADGETVVDERYPAPQEDPNPFDTDRNPRHGA